MKSSLLSAAVLSVAFGFCSLAAGSNGKQLVVSPARASNSQQQAQDQNQVRAFTETIAKSGDKFVLREDAGRSTIHVQTIEEASA